MIPHYLTLAQKSLQGQKIVRGRHNLLPRAFLRTKFQWRMWLPLPEVMAVRAREVLGAVLVFERPARKWRSPVCGTSLVYTRCRSTVALSLT